MKNMLTKMGCVAFASTIFLSNSIAGTGWLQSYVHFWDGTGDKTYTLLDVNGPLADYPGSLTGTPIGALDGANLGTFDLNQSYQLYLNSYISAWADGGDTYSNFSLVYRFFKNNETPGAFITDPVNSIVNISGNDFRGLADGNNLSGLSVGNYTLQLYLARTHSWSTGSYTTYFGTSGDTSGVAPTGSELYSASFSIVPEPSSASLMALGTAGLLALRRRRNS